jgi:hypothetical protein
MTPQWKYMVLPVILLIFLVVSLTVFLVTGGIFNRYACAIDAESLNATPPSLTTPGSNQTRMSDNPYFRMNTEITNLRPFYLFAESFSVIDPLLPLPCSLYPTNSQCNSYLSHESYTCLTALVGELMNASQYQQAIPPFERTTQTPVFWLLVIGSAVILLVEGYIISRIVFFLHHRTKIHHTAHHYAYHRKITQPRKHKTHKRRRR